MKLATAIGLVAALMVPGHAAGAKKKAKHRCGGQWTGSATCTIRYAGGDLSLGGGFQAAQAGFVSITLEAIDPATGVRVPVLNCGVAGGNFGGCGTSSSGSPPIELERGQKLFCSVQGAESGTFKCKSYRA